MSGDRALAQHELSNAARMLTALNMDLHATVAKRALGTLQGGSAGHEAIEACDKWLEAQGVANPERFTAVF